MVSSCLGQTTQPFVILSPSIAKSHKLHILSHLSKIRPHRWNGWLSIASSLRQTLTLNSQTFHLVLIKWTTNITKNKTRGPFLSFQTLKNKPRQSSDLPADSTTSLFPCPVPTTPLVVKSDQAFAACRFSRDVDAPRASTMDNPVQTRPSYRM